MDPGSATPFEQPAASQRPYAAQTTIITPTSVTGDAPLILHFHSLFDRPPVGTERDIQLDVPTLIDIARFLV